METSEFVNELPFRKSASILQGDDISGGFTSISHALDIESNLVKTTQIIKDDKDNTLGNERNSTPILQNEHVVEMSGGLSTKNTE